MIHYLIKLQYYFYMTIAFFEIQPWEKQLLQQFFPDAIFSEDPLSEKNIDVYKDIEIISCFIYSKITADIINHLPALKFIATRSTGFDHIDVPFCQSKNISVSNVPDYGSHTVAEHTFALILTLSRKIHQSINQAKQLNFDHAEIKGIDLFGKTIGIIGLGKIGIEVLKIAHGFGMKVLVYTRTQKPELASQYGFTYGDLNTVLSHADIISLHIPYSSTTHHIINQTNITTMKSGSYVINTARGSLIETEAILMGLQHNILAGVGLDVLEGEKELTEEVDILSSSFQQETNLKTLVLDHVLMNHPRVVITPHNAFNSHEALLKILDVTKLNIHSFLQDAPINVVF